MPLEPWKTLRSRLLIDRSPWLRLLAEDVQLPDGRVVHDYLRLESPDFVVVVPVDESGRIGLVRSYKRGPDRIDLQPPAGLIDPGEAAPAAAARELREEAGCLSTVWTEMGTYVVSGNTGAGRAHVYLATGKSRLPTQATWRSRSWSGCRSRTSVACGWAARNSGSCRAWPPSVWPWRTFQAESRRLTALPPPASA